MKGSEARLERARPAEPLKPRRDLGVLQVQVIAAIGADELEHAGVAAFGAAVHDADRLAPQVSRAAVAGLTGERAQVDAVRPSAQPRVTATARSWCGDGGQTDSGSGTGHGVSGVRTAHLTHPQAVVPTAAGI